jgi:hypothetical protein
MSKEIPQHIKAAIEAEADKRFPIKKVGVYGAYYIHKLRKPFIEFAEYGYLLSQGEDKKEVEYVYVPVKVHEQNKIYTKELGFVKKLPLSSLLPVSSLSEEEIEAKAEKILLKHYGRPNQPFTEQQKKANKVYFKAMVEMYKSSQQQ